MFREYFYNLANDRIKGRGVSLLKFIFFLLSLIYSVTVKILAYAYKTNILKTKHLNCKVISVGNITWGGTGKTPIVEMLCLKLAQEGRQVAIQSRGYKIKKRVGNFQFKTNRCRLIGDEPWMLQENLHKIPVIVGKDRLNQARLALDKFHLDTLVLDDGFQHWRLFRDLDILAIDATNPFGNGFLIPRGILRESLSALKRADIFFLTHTDLGKENLTWLKQKLEKINLKAPIIESIHQPIGFYNILDNPRKINDINSLKEKNVCLLTSIGNPISFEKTVLNLGLKIVLKFVFLDHYEFSQNDFDKITSACLRQGTSTLLTTQKDAVRLKEFSRGVDNCDILVLRIEIQITQNADIFFDRLFSLYQR